MSTEREIVNRQTRNMERLAGMLGIAAAVFAALALLWWRGRASVALLGCTVSLTAFGFSIYSSARKAITILEAEKDGSAQAKGEYQ